MIFCSDFGAVSASGCGWDADLRRGSGTQHCPDFGRELVGGRGKPLHGMPSDLGLPHRHQPG